MNRKFIYRRILVMILVVSMIYTGYFVYSRFDNAIPDKISVFSDEIDDIDNILDTELPVGASIKNNKITETSMQRSGNYSFKCSLFGIIDFKSIEVDVIETTHVTPCGFQAGIYLHSNGVMVVDVTNVQGNDGLIYEPAYGKLQVGDYIMKINGIPVSDKEQFTFLLNQYGEDKLKLTVYRNNREIEVIVNPVIDKEYIYRLGIWIRDDLQGIGTITYITDDNEFGALGHGISDSDTGKLLECENGKLYTANIWGIKRGSSGSPGGLCGVINYGEDNLLGSININSEKGIFGKANKDMVDMCKGFKEFPIALKQDIEKGRAYIRCELGGEIKDYEIKITDIKINDNKNKGIVLEVVDKELLSETNGIVQGMSGSPIIQNGRIVGAVTHVLVNNPARGYGIFIEEMLKQN